MAKPAKSKKPLISVIIPAYNVAPYLAKCLDSVLASTYSNLEIILVDDGSTDESPAICQSYLARDHRISYFRQKNAGLSAARNAGLEHATGEYLTFVDSDDFIDPSMIDKLYNLCHNHNTKLSICSFSEFSSPKSTSEASLPSDSDLRPFASPALQSSGPQIFSTAACLTNMLQETGFTMSAWGKLYHRSLFEHLRFPVGRLYEDVGTTYRAVLACPSIAFCPDCLYFYRQSASSIIHQPWRPQKLDLIDLTDAMCDDILAAFPDLENLTNLRRMHACFSILRQLPSRKNCRLDRRSNHKTSSQITEQGIVTFLRQHRDFVFKNPLASKREHLAMLTLLLGPSFFRFSWRLYSRLR